MSDTTACPMHDVLEAQKGAARTKTHKVMVGNVAVGGGAPIAIQSMCTTKTEDPKATLQQIQTLADAGCEIIRVAIPRAEALQGFGKICAKSPIPVVADIHFDYKLALQAADLGASALRINPGNIGSMDRVDAVIEKAKEVAIPIRIGVNAGSLDPSVDTRQDLTLSQKLVASAAAYVDHFKSRDFHDIVVSAKAHSVPITIETYRELSCTLPDIPLHIGVTEAGTLRQGSTKNSVACGILLNEGIGDTMRLSLTADPVEEIYLAWELLASLGIRRNHPELVSCPTCGRCKVNLIKLASEVEERLSKLSAPISVAVMGCVVNGPGEARDADLGIACGDGKGVLFENGNKIRTIDEANIVDELMAEIDARYGA